MWGGEERVNALSMNGVILLACIWALLMDVWLRRYMIPLSEIRAFEKFHLETILKLLLYLGI